MKAKRVFHKETILNFHKKIEERKADKIDVASSKYCACSEMCNMISYTYIDTDDSLIFVELSRNVNLPSSNTEEINAAFSTVVVPKKRSSDDLYKISKKKRCVTKRDEEFYIPYSAPDKHTEDG